MESGGLMEQHAYSYTGAVRLSSFDPSRIVVRIANFTAVPAGEDGHIWALLVHRGPPAVGLHVLLMPTYVGGCRARSSAFRRGVNYGVLLVSYGALGFAALRLGYWPYWVIKNSWGSRHYGKQGLCRAPRAHGKGLKTHGKPFAVRFLSGRTAKGAR
jgi:cathepsin F